MERNKKKADDHTDYYGGIGMDQIQKALEDLIAAVESCEEYQGYLAAKKEIEKHPLLKKKADEFRKLKFDLQGSETDIFEKTDTLRQEHAEVNSNPIVWEYLTTENVFCRILRQINWELLESLDFDAGFQE